MIFFFYFFEVIERQVYIVFLSMKLDPWLPWLLIRSKQSYVIRHLG